MDTTHVRKTTDLEPVFYSTANFEYHDEICNILQPSAALDFTPGIALRAYAHILRAVPYVGLAMTDVHKDWLWQRIEEMLVTNMVTEGEKYYDNNFAKLCHEKKLPKEKNYEKQT